MAQLPPPAVLLASRTFGRHRARLRGTAPRAVHDQRAAAHVGTAPRRKAAGALGTRRRANGNGRRGLWIRRTDFRAGPRNDELHQETPDRTAFAALDRR